MAQSEVCTESVPRHVQNSGLIFKSGAYCGPFFIHINQKCLWAQPMTDSKPGNVVLNNVIVVGFKWFLFSLYLVVFFRFPTKNMHYLCNLKKKKSTQGIKDRVVKWVTVCQRNFTSFFVSSICTHATNEFNGLSLSLEISSVLLLIWKQITSRKQRQLSHGTTPEKVLW